MKSSRQSFTNITFHGQRSEWEERRLIIQDRSAAGRLPWFAISITQCLHLARDGDVSSLRQKVRYALCFSGAEGLGQGR